MHATEQVVGGVAHNFNNLLAAITGHSELLLLRLGRSNPLYRHAEEIRKTADRAATLTHQLLAFSGQQVLAPTVLDLNAVVVNLDQPLRRLIGEGIKLLTVLDPALGRVQADPEQLEQVLLSLADNARDAMPQGGTLTIKTANIQSDEASAHQHVGAHPGAYVTLSVCDTGCGMDAEVQSHLFEPFFTTKEPGKGTGLGLASVYGIVTQSGGHIAVSSEPGRGATFTIYLPRVEDAGEAVRARPPASTGVPQDSVIILVVDDEEDAGEVVRARPPAPAGVPRDSVIILVVDDEEVVQAVVCEMLQMSGYTVMAASSGGEALLLCELHPGPIHLMVTDVVMPQMSGYELAQHAALLRPEMRVLFMSGYPDSAIDHHRVMDRDTAFLRKPFTLDALMRKVREVLDAPQEGQRVLHGRTRGGKSTRAAHVPCQRSRAEVDI